MKGYKTEVLAGLAVATALIPEALGFSIIAGVPPTAGLYAAFVVGLVTSVFGGRPGMISGATGAIAVGLASLTSTHGLEYIFPTVILGGLLQIVVALLRLDKFIKLVSYPVMLGFVNGLAILILVNQAAQFQAGVNGHWEWLHGRQLYTMLGLVGLSILVMVILPQITKAVPAALAAVVVVFLVVSALGLPVKTIGDIASVSGNFPPFHLANIPFTFETLKIIFPYSVIMAGVGLIESLLTLNLIDQITATKGDGNREAMVQGAANILSGFFSGMGGCAMIGQSLLNMSAGGKGRISGIVSSVMILVIIMFGAPLIERVPMPALVGLMIMISLGAFKKETLQLIGKRPATDLVVSITVAGITVILHNLALGVVTGVIISALAFAWDNSKRLWAVKHIDTAGAAQYKIYGPLFFGSVATFHDQFDISNDPREITVDLSEIPATDLSGTEAVKELVRRYNNVGKQVYLRYTDKDKKILFPDDDNMNEAAIK